MSGQDSKYFLKYLKYKNKYLQLKRIEKEQLGGVTLLEGEYIIFAPKGSFTIKQNGKAPSVQELNDKLEGTGFRIKVGSNEAELIRESDSTTVLRKTGSSVVVATSPVIGTIASAYAAKQALGTAKVQDARFTTEAAKETLSDAVGFIKEQAKKLFSGKDVAELKIKVTSNATKTNAKQVFNLIKTNTEAKKIIGSKNYEAFIVQINKLKSNTYQTNTIDLM